MCQAQKSVLFVGESGTAKTVAIQKYFNGLPTAGYLILSMNFSSRTTSMDVQLTVEDSVEKRTKVTLKFLLNNSKGKIMSGCIWYDYFPDLPPGYIWTSHGQEYDSVH